MAKKSSSKKRVTRATKKVSQLARSGTPFNAKRLSRASLERIIRDTGGKATKTAKDAARKASTELASRTNSKRKK